jgi:hypothetical protein
MAGSYLHCVDGTGRLRDPQGLGRSLDCCSGDVCEAVRELYGMIWFLAGGDPTRVADARARWQEGIGMSPGLAEPGAG